MIFLYIGILLCYKTLRNVKKDEKYALISIYNKKEGRYVFMLFSMGGFGYGIILLSCAIFRIGWASIWISLGIVIPAIYSFCGFFLLSRITSKTLLKKPK
jgi:hypothetical protein